MKKINKQLKLLKAGSYVGSGDYFNFPVIKLSSKEMKKRMNIFMKLMRKLNLKNKRIKSLEEVYREESNDSNHNGFNGLKEEDYNG